MVLRLRYSSAGGFWSNVERVKVYIVAKFRRKAQNQVAANQVFRSCDRIYVLSKQREFLDGSEYVFAFDSGINNTQLSDLDCTILVWSIHIRDL